MSKLLQFRTLPSSTWANVITDMASCRPLVFYMFGFVAVIRSSAPEKNAKKTCQKTTIAQNSSKLYISGLLFCAFLLLVFGVCLLFQNGRLLFCYVFAFCICLFHKVVCLFFLSFSCFYSCFISRLKAFHKYRCYKRSLGDWVITVKVMSWVRD